MTKHRVEISETESIAINGVIPVVLTGNVADWPYINIYWDGVHYGKTILGDTVARNGNTLLLPEKMAGDRIVVDYWTTDGLISRSNESVSSNTGYGVCDRIRFIISNWLRDADLSTNIPVATNVNNVKTEWRSRVLRQTDLTQPTVICGVLPYIHQFSGFGIAGHSISAGGSIQIELLQSDGCDDPNGVTVYNSGELLPTLIKRQGDEFVWGVDPWGIAEDDGIDPVFSAFFDSYFANVFRITITDPNNPNGYFDVSQIFLGDTLQLDRNFNYGLGITWKNAQQLHRTEGGSLLTVGNRQQWRELQLPFEHMTERDREVMSRQQRMAPGESIFLSAFPSGTENEQKEFAMACKFESPSFTKNFYQNWQSNITFLET